MIRNACYLSARGRLCLQRRCYSLSRYIDIAPEVHDALLSRLPVVALESTIITHGMPYPTNLTTALSVETRVRSTGAIPATIAILRGRVIVGMTKSQLEYISTSNGSEDFIKVSRRDLATMVGLRLSGGTTISATSLIASLVGIKVFATGGLGGVHRGGEATWDVSADLAELGRTPIAVVSAGVKSILDIERTLEYLETQGVSVITYGPDRRFPGFYVPYSGYKSPWNVNSPEEAARIIEANHSLNLQSGMLFAAPIPEQFSKDAAIIQEAIDKAVKESEEKHINKLGKEATPWILRRVAELSQGKSIPSNIALIENTARIGGQIAVEYSKLLRSENYSKTPDFPASKQFEYTDTRASNGVSMEVSTVVHQDSKPLLVVGGAVMDVISQQDSTSLGALHNISTTLPGEVKFSPGGVARNIAEAAHRILSTSQSSRETQVILISPVGNDHAGQTLVNDCRRLGMRTDGIFFKAGRTAICNQVLDLSGELLTGIADMSIMETTESTPILSLIEAQLPGLIAFDANFGPRTLSDLLAYCVKCQIPTFFEPTSVPKSTYILPALKNVLQLLGHHQSAPITFVSPNRLELSHMYEAMKLSEDTLIGSSLWWSVMDDLALGETYRSDLTNFSRAIHMNEGLNFFEEGILQMAVSLIPFFQHLFIKLGKHGVLVVMRIPKGKTNEFSWENERSSTAKRQVLAKGRNSLLVLKHYPALSLEKEIINVTGAGDSFAGSLITDLIGKEFLLPIQLDEAVERAQCAAVLSLISPEAVSPELRFGQKNILV